MSSATKQTSHGPESTAGDRFVHLHQSEASFCGSREFPRQFSVSADAVTCPTCKQRWHMDNKFTDVTGRFAFLTKFAAAIANADGR